MNNSDINTTFQPFIQQLRSIPDDGISSNNSDLKRPATLKKADDGDILNINLQTADDKLLSTDALTSLKINAKQISQLPDYAYRGLKGDPDADFHEFIQLGKIPYVVGQPMLVAMFPSRKHSY